MLGEKLKYLRKNTGLTLREVARSAGCSYARLCELENEKGYNPRVLTLDKLANFYSADPSELFSLAVASAKERCGEQ